MNFKLSTTTICLSAFIFFATALHAQTKKFDTTVKMGDAGYRVQCNNKNADQNDITINPINLKTTTTGNPSFAIYGKATRALIDDFNDDGLPDLVICVYNESNNTFSAVGLSYTADKSFEGISFPDIYLDAKIREGYKGHDEFSALTGTLLRKFPIYLSADTDKPTGGMRTIQYKVMRDNGRLTFKVLRWFDVKS